MLQTDTKASDNKSVNENLKTAEGLQAQLADKMMELFNVVISDRSKHYNQNPEKIPDKNSISVVIKSYSMTNAAISGGASLIPGPWGMAASIPEIVAVIRNQLVMIYDIGMAYGKKDVLTKELLAGVLLTAMGAGAGTLLVMHGGKVLIKRATLRVFQRIILILAGKVTQQLLKSMISKWLPVVGAAAMAVWSNYLTRQVGKKAVEIFEKEIEFATETVEEIPDEIAEKPFVKQVSDTPTISIERLKVQALINLLKVDGKITPEEIEYVHTIVDNINLSNEEKTKLLDAIDSSTKFTIDYTSFVSMPDDAIGLLIDLVALAKRDGEFHIAEKMYVKQAGKLMGFSENDVEETMVT